MRISHAARGTANRSFNIPGDKCVLSPGTYTDANADGYWIMLEPLGSGAHTRHFGGTSIDYVGPDPVLTVPSFTADVATRANAGGGDTAAPLPPVLLGALPMAMAAPAA